MPLFMPTGSGWSPAAGQSKRASERAPASPGGAYHVGSMRSPLSHKVLTGGAGGAASAGPGIPPPTVGIFHAPSPSPMVGFGTSPPPSIMKIAVPDGEADYWFHDVAAETGVGLADMFQNNTEVLDDFFNNAMPSGANVTSATTTTG